MYVVLTAASVPPQMRGKIDNGEKAALCSNHPIGAPVGGHGVGVDSN